MLLILLYRFASTFADLETLVEKSNQAKVSHCWMPLTVVAQTSGCAALICLRFISKICREPTTMTGLMPTVAAPSPVVAGLYVQTEDLEFNRFLRPV